jgi:hypothetical protein
LAIVALESGLADQKTVLRRKCVQHVETNVMSRALETGARVPNADDQFHAQILQQSEGLAHA